MKSKMRLSSIVFFLGLSGVLAIATVFLASVLFKDFNLWVKTLSAAEVRILPPFFTLTSVIFIITGLFFRRNSSPSESGL